MQHLRAIRARLSVRSRVGAIVHKTLSLPGYPRISTWPAAAAGGGGDALSHPGWAPTQTPFARVRTSRPTSRSTTLGEDEVVRLRVKRRRRKNAARRSSSSMLVALRCSASRSLFAAQSATLVDQAAAKQPSKLPDQLPRRVRHLLADFGLGSGAASAFAGACSPRATPAAPTRASKRAEVGSSALRWSSVWPFHDTQRLDGARQRGAAEPHPGLLRRSHGSGTTGAPIAGTDLQRERHDLHVHEGDRDLDLAG